jgi:glycosyltransferase involved in cell wall biosynthesis
MSPRVAFWTGAFRPNVEAIAGEVALLRRQCALSIAWGLHPDCWMLLSAKPDFCLNPRLHLVFRAVTRLLEPMFQLNHIFGSMSDWFYLAGQRTRPTVLTQAAFGDPFDVKLLDRVDTLVAECPRDVAHMQCLGIGRDRIRLIYPSVNLERFAPRPAPEGPFTVLFASSPDAGSWLEARGLAQLLDAAALRPALRFRLLWRPWGDSLPRIKQWIAERSLTNVELVLGQNGNMAQEYTDAHVTVAPFTQSARCKPAPNSLVESMACGRPVVVTHHVGLADVIRDEQTGVVCDATGPALAEAFDRVQAEWHVLAVRARHVAERLFSERTFVAGYERIYAELMARTAVKRVYAANHVGSRAGVNGYVRI